MQAQAIPSISEQMLKELRDAFRSTDIKPDTDINTIMYDAGAQEVIRFLERHKRNSEMLGDINATRLYR